MNFENGDSQKPRIINRYDQQSMELGNLPLPVIANNNNNNRAVQILKYDVIIINGIKSGNRFQHFTVRRGNMQINQQIR